MKRTILSWGVTLVLFILGFTLQAQAQCSGDCFDFKLVSTTPNVEKQTVRLSFSVITKCPFDLSHVAFELPAGVKAIAPIAQVFEYKIENTTNSPFYSLKFEEKRQGEGIVGYKNGKEDIFTFEISTEAYNSMSSMRIEAKASQNVGTITIKNFEATIAGPTSPCVNEPQTYKVTLKNSNGTVPGGDFMYSWKVPAGWVITSGTGTNSIAVIPGITDGEVSVTVTTAASNGCGSDSDAISVVTKENCVLPVELASFNGVSRNGAVELAWSTASEINNELFEVERSADGRAFAKVGEVKGNGNSTAVIDYSFTDRSAFSGAVYYRLRQMDFDGASEYSKVIAVSHSAGASSAAMSVYPNPVTDGKFIIRFAKQVKEGANVRLVDLNGRVLHTNSLNGSSTETEINLSGLNLKQGLYLITVTNNGQNSTQRIMIK